MKIIYTDSAKIELDQFLAERKKELELLIRREKYIFGDNIIEITASDIQAANNKFRMHEESSNRFRLLAILPTIYAVSGIIFISLGLFKNKLIEMYNSEPSQLAFILLGILMILVSYFLKYYLLFRKQNFSPIEDQIKKYEDILQDENDLRKMEVTKNRIKKYNKFIIQRNIKKYNEEQDVVNSNKNNS